MPATSPSFRCVIPCSSRRPRIFQATERAIEVLDVCMAHGVGFGTSGEIDNADDVAIVDVVRRIQTVDRYGIVTIQSARMDAVGIGHTPLHYILLHSTMAPR